LLVVVTPHIVKPVPVGEQIKLPEMPEGFLKPETPKKKKQKKDPKQQPEVVGERGYQKPPPPPTQPQL
jgi:hypothetical protein